MRKTDEMMDNPLVLSGLIKDVVGNIFLTNEDLTNLVMPVLDDDDYSYEDNWFGCRIKKNLNGQLKDVSLVGHCKDTPYMEETITDARSMILMETYVNTSSSILDYTLVINVVARKDVIDLDDDEKSEWRKKGYAGNRLDMICQAINLALTDESIKDSFGIGAMRLDTRTSQLQSFKPNTNFYGRTMVYRIDDINMELLRK
jgi:hypothetical protein|nr:MAG TPA: hypothetical protein [Caudoviricetes sp.]